LSDRSARILEKEDSRAERRRCARKECDDGRKDRRAERRRSVRINEGLHGASIQGW